MYELMILAYLMRGPMHGYLIAKIINDIIGPFARVSNGRLYPLLTKLEAEGLIVPAEVPPQGRPHERRSRAFQITEAGRDRFHQAMMDTTSNPGDYRDLFWVKVQFLEYLQPTEQVYLIDHYTNFCQAHIFHLIGEMNDLEREAPRKRYMTPHQLEVTLGTMQHLQDRWHLEMEAARRLRARAVAQNASAEQAQSSDHDRDYHYDYNHHHTNA